MKEESSPELPGGGERAALSPEGSWGDYVKDSPWS